jgi:hypothetical protein
MQISILHKFMKRKGMDARQFLALDREKDILGFLREGYEPFHLMGEDGILEELEAYAAI